MKPENDDDPSSLPPSQWDDILSEVELHFSLKLEFSVIKSCPSPFYPAVSQLYSDFI